MRAWKAGLLAPALAMLAGCDVPALIMASPPPGAVPPAGYAPPSGAVPAGWAPFDPLASTARRFGWEPRPGATAYQVVATSDPAGTAIAALSSFTGELGLPLEALSWREGHPLAGRPYYWVVRAYDRPDPQGLVLATSDPREFRSHGGEAMTWRVTGPDSPR